MVDTNWFLAERPRLFAIAYRMLGSASEAEDTLQDAWLRLSRADMAHVRSLQAFATTTVTRLCLDRLKSARSQREQYVGPWLPEPVLTDANRSPDVLAERAESVTFAFLTLLEELSAEERAVFLLKEVFEYEHAEIANMLGTTAANSRQLLHRARARVRDIRAADVRATADRRTLATRFAEAFRAGDAAELTTLLAADVTLVSDGGGKVVAARRPLSGREEVLRLLTGLHRTAQATGLAAQVSAVITEINAEVALVLYVAGKLDGVFVLATRGDEITGIRVVRNPDKLAFLDRQLAS
jgi:RNA polymerase sigma-70 factor (ECF subfamily)